jgi:hypothetical protein
LNAQKKSAWRKLAVIIFLPIIIVVWMVGWTLTVVGSDKGNTPVKQPHQHNIPRYGTDTLSEDESHEEAKAPLEPQIAI